MTGHELRPRIRLPLSLIEIDKSIRALKLPPVRPTLRATSASALPEHAFNTRQHGEPTVVRESTAGNLCGPSRGLLPEARGIPKGTSPSPAR